MIEYKTGRKKQDTKLYLSFHPIWLKKRCKKKKI